MENIISIEHLYVNYEHLTVLENINLKVHNKDFLCIIGPNGGGKTTLLKVILGLIKPEKGSITVFNQSPEQARDKIGYVPQYHTFDRNFPIDVFDAVLMGNINNKKYFKKFSIREREKAEQSLAEVDMLNFLHRQVGKLSGGQIQRILIARALVSNPKLLLLDEPTASIDTKVGMDVYEILRKLNEEITIILVSHDIGVISSYAKQIACLNKYLYYHETKEITDETIQAMYKCPVDLIAHGVPHRVLGRHKSK